MSRKSWFVAAGLVLLAFLFTGCHSVVYRSETVLHSDGKVRRAISQLASETPDEVRDPKNWRKTTYAAEETLDDRGQPVPLTELPAQPQDHKHPYFVGWQDFASPKDIIDHVALRSSIPESTLPSGKLVRDYGRTDYVFVVEHRWKETLTDSWRRDDMRQARAELADLMIRVGEDVFNEVLGEEYDASRLIKWLRTEGKAWGTELTDAAFLYAAAGPGKVTPEGVLEDVAVTCARRGLELKSGGTFLKYEELNKRLEEYAAGLLLAHVRRKDGKLPGKDEFASLVREFQNKQKRTRFQLAMDRVIHRKYGGKAAFEKRAYALLGRVTGLYLFDLGVHLFDYTLTVPGEVIAANGTWLAPNCVRWQFPVTEAFPLGYPMECRSLEPQASLQQELLSSKPLTSRSTMLDYHFFLEKHKDLLPVLQECRKQKRMTPLVERRKELADAAAKAVHAADSKDDPMVLSSQARLRTVERLFRILQLK